MGLPESTLILSGHQAGVWHAGILAKHIATTAAARAMGAAAAWIVVDQDAGDPQGVAYPGAVWERREWNAPSVDGSARAVGKRSAQSPPPAPSLALCDSVQHAIERVRARAEAHAGAESLASQFALANADLLANVTTPCPLTFATRIARTNLFRACVDRMLTDPARCVEGYNAAARARPEAGISVLEPGADSELPVWVLEADGTRVRARVSMLRAGVDHLTLAPRALLMTMLLRLAACDLFVHGLGGGVYDTITEAWIRSWMPEAELAPTAVVSATRFARPDGAPLGPTPADVKLAVWVSHRARHDPHVLGLHDLGNHKDELVRAVRHVRETGGKARAAYMEMQAWLESYRESRKKELDALRDKAAAMRSAAEPGAGMWDRTWPWVFLNPTQIEGLREEVHRAFGVPKGYATT